MKRRPLVQAQAEFDAAEMKLRAALLRIQSHRIDALLRSDVPDVQSEINYLMGQGRYHLVPKIIEVMTQFVEARVHLNHMSSDSHKYEEMVDPEEPTPEYLK